MSPADFTFAFQPIVDIRTGRAYSHEALVRGLANEPAWQILGRHAGAGAAAFDAACRAKAIEVASRTGVDTHLNLNFLPSAAFDPRLGLDSTVEAAQRHGFPLDRIIMEATETEAISDHVRFAESVNQYRRAGLQFAIDDFGAGYSGLNLLAEFQPDMVKLDMALVRGIESHGPRQAILRAINQVCVDLGIDVVVEGVETVAEFAWCHALGIHLYQGYLFAKPMFEAMPGFEVPAVPGGFPPALKLVATGPLTSRRPGEGRIDHPALLDSPANGEALWPGPTPGPATVQNDHPTRSFTRR